MALTTGRGEVTGQLLLGDAIDRAAQRLVQRAQQARGEPDRHEEARALISIDDVTAGLLDGRFDVRDSVHGKELHGELERAAFLRRGHAEPISCVGRDRELNTLRALFHECIEESVARVALVTAPPGIGKTRLAYELLREIREHGAEGAPFLPADVWIARADPLRVGSAWSLLGEVIRGAAGMLEEDPRAVWQAKLEARIARHVPPAEQARVMEVLSETVATLYTDVDTTPTWAARTTAQTMGEQVQRAWEDFVAAECAAHPVLILLDDLHWADHPSLRFISAALANLKSLPWMVLGLARPEIHELFPRLWVERDAQQIRLDQLTRKAGERLIRQALGHGSAVPKELVERLLAMADGNAFYLEELIRAVAQGKRDALPETVVAMVEAGLESLEAEARRVLRAASIFGEVFWQGGVEALLGGATRGAHAGEWLSLLVDREVLVVQPESRFPGETELRFRHTLLREGAYAMLTESDRVLGHRLAAAYLEAQGESDALVLAEHWERGREPDRAQALRVRADIA